MNGSERLELSTPPLGYLDMTSVTEVSDDPLPEPRAARRAEDARLVDEAATLLGSLSADPLALLEVAQQWLRDIGVDAREEGALSASERTAIETAAREVARESERANRESAEESRTIANVFGWIATGLAAIGGVVGAAFTGGASLALAITAAVLMVGAQTVNQLSASGVIEDHTAAMGVSIGLSVLAAALSFGASSAGCAAQASSGAAQTALTAAETAAKASVAATQAAANFALSTATSVAQFGSGIADLCGTAFEYAADQDEVRGETHRVARDALRATAEEEVEALGAIMSSFRRMAERRAEARDAIGRGALIAANALRG